MYYEYGYRYLMTIWGMLTEVDILVVVSNKMRSFWTYKYIDISKKQV